MVGIKFRPSPTPRPLCATIRPMNVMKNIEEVVDSYRKNENGTVTFVGNAIIFSKKKDKLGFLLYVIILILLPLVIAFYCFIFSSSFIGILFVIWSILSSRDFIKMNKGENILTIDNDTKTIKILNNSLFKRFYLQRVIPMEDVREVRVRKESVYARYSSTEWYRMFLINRQGDKLVGLDFNSNNSKKLANQVKNIIEKLR